VDAGNYLSNTGIDIAADSGGNFFVTWGGSNLFNDNIYLKAIYGSGSSLSSEIKVSQGFDFNNSPSIAIDSEDTIIVAGTRFPWQTSSPGSARYTPAGMTMPCRHGDEFKVNLSY